MRQTQRDHHFLKLFFDGLQMLDDALSRSHCDTREGRMLGDPRLRNRIVERSKVVRGPADDEQERVEGGMDNLRIGRFGAHIVLKSYTLNAMRCLTTTIAFLCLLAFAATGAAQPGAVYVHHDRVNAALAKGGVLVTTPQVQIAGGHLDKPGSLETREATTILYVTDGEGIFAAGALPQRLGKGDVIVVPAGTPQSFTSVSPSISYFLVAVPVTAIGAKAELVYVPHEKVAASLKKAGPLADGPNLRVSGGYRTGPYAPADYRPDVEIHANEVDLFYVIEGRATQVLGGDVVGGRQTAPRQIRGSKIDGGQTYQLSKGDVMWVPAGMPHWFPEIPEPLSYLLVKVFY
jgi:quercetin dioxygenase-like cupin family protein